MAYLMLSPPTSGDTSGNTAGYSPAINDTVITMTANSTPYSCRVGGFISVPIADAQVLMANGWQTNHNPGNGTTAQRPVGINTGTTFYDDTLAAMISWDGAFWRNGSGAIV